MNRFGLAIVATLLLFAACRKDGGVGLSLLNDGLQTGMVDSFTVLSEQVTEDTIKTKNPQRILIGQRNDVAFGDIQAGFCAQFVPTTNTSSITGAVSIDSSVITFPFAGYAGDTSASITFEVFELDTELHADSVYTNKFSPKIGAKIGGITYSNGCKPSTYISIKEPTATGGDSTVSRIAQVRITIDAAVARRLLLSGKNTSATDFLAYFKGVYVRATVNSSNGGAIYYLSPASSLSTMTIFFHEGTNFKKYEYLHTSTSTWVNVFKYDQSSSLASLQMGPRNPQITKLYVEGMGGFKGKFTFPYIRNLLAEKKDLAINRAELILPLDPSNNPNSGFYAPRLGLLAADSNGKNDILSDFFSSLGIFNGYYDKTKNAYVMNITQYMQDLVYSDKDYGVLVQAYYGGIDGFRTIISTDTSGLRLNNPKLRIIFTKIK